MLDRTACGFIKLKHAHRMCHILGQTHQLTTQSGHDKRTWLYFIAMPWCAQALLTYCATPTFSLLRTEAMHPCETELGMHQHCMNMIIISIAHILHFALHTKDSKLESDVSNYRCNAEDCCLADYHLKIRR